MRRLARWIPIAFPLLTGCGVLLWSSVYEATAPGGDSKVSVEVNSCSSDCAVRVIVKQGWTSKEIARKSDCFVAFAHAAWSGTKVAVFVDGTFCRSIEGAFDLASGQPIDYQQAKEWLARSIIQSYAVTPEELKANDGDVFKWATYPGDGRKRRSMEEFQRRHRPN